MSFIYMIILAFSLSIDAMGIGLSYGIRGIKIPVNAKIITGSISFFVILISMTFGNFLCGFMSQKTGEIIGAVLLFITGLWIIFQGTKPKKKKEKKEKTLNFMIKSLGISVKIIQSPEFCDLNKSSVIEASEALYLGMALSFDSVGVGITSSVFGFNKFLFSFIVCVFQIFLLSTGVLFGKKINTLRFIDKISNIFSGGILITIAFFKMFF